MIDSSLVIVLPNDSRKPTVKSIKYLLDHYVNYKILSYDESTKLYLYLPIISISKLSNVRLISKVSLLGSEYTISNDCKIYTDCGFKSVSKLPGNLILTVYGGLELNHINTILNYDNNLYRINNKNNTPICLSNGVVLMQPTFQ